MAGETQAHPCASTTVPVCEPPECSKESVLTRHQVLICVVVSTRHAVLCGRDADEYLRTVKEVLLSRNLPIGVYLRNTTAFLLTPTSTCSNAGRFPLVVSRHPKKHLENLELG